jgi:hypothetical protein
VQMYRQRVLSLVCGGMFFLFPFVAQGQDFCSSLKRVIDDSSNGFRNVVTMQLPGFRACSLGGTNKDTYTCDSQPTKVNLVTAVKQCLANWTYTVQESDLLAGHNDRARIGVHQVARGTGGDPTFSLVVTKFP